MTYDDWRDKSPQARVQFRRQSTDKYVQATDWQIHERARPIFIPLSSLYAGGESIASQHQQPTSEV